MTEKWVINASPIICLGKASQLGLLEKICSEIIIPEGVLQEVLQGPDGDPGKNWLKGEGSQWVREIGEIDPQISAWDLGMGESQVLSWAYRNPEYEALLDDGVAIKCASALNIPARRTVSVVLLAKKRGLLMTVRPVLEQLMQAGLYLSDTVFKRALDLAGELEE